MTTQRNVVLLMTDQQRFDTIAALGNDRIRTPNLDRLRRMGTAFTHAVTPVPVCGAARNALFTGAGSKTLGDAGGKLRWRPNARSIQSTLSESGYKTGGFGKMHFETTGDGFGFTELKLHEEVQENGREFRRDDDYHQYLADVGLGHIRYTGGVRNLLYNQPQVSPVPEEHHETPWVADRALEFIDAYRTVPFFCFASWMQPHWPVHVPKTWADLYDPGDMRDPGWSEAEQDHLPWFVKLCRRACDMADPGKPVALHRIRRAISLYYASISFIDHQVGRMLDRLELHGLLNDTLVLFTSDHGELLFDHLGISKCVAYDASIRVPLIAAGPGMENPGASSADFVTLSDLAPTIYEFTGVEPTPGLELCGASLLGDRAEVRSRDAAFSEIGNGPGGGFVCIRTRRWKYVFNHYGGLRQLFDLEDDPDELENLLLNADAEAERIAGDLHRRLLAWSREHSVPSRIADGEFVAVPEPPLWEDRNNQYDAFVDNLPGDEKANLWSEARSVYEAIKDEPQLDPAELDLEFWESKRGPGCIAELESLLGRKLR